MGLSEWLLVLPRERDWEAYYLPIIATLTSPVQIWHYKLRIKPEKSENTFNSYPRDGEWVFLAWRGVIQGRLSIHSVDFTAVEGYPVTSGGISQGIGYYVHLSGPFRTTEFLETDGGWLPSDIQNIPKGMPDLRRLEF
jgi:hypothetical protein